MPGGATAAELEAWNAAQKRCRRAYAQGEHAGAVKPNCACGARTTHPSGLCRRCRV